MFDPHQPKLALPINEQEIVQTVTSLQGIVDDQTLLSQLWFIRDPAEALENIKRQKQENQREYQATFGAAQSETEDEQRNEQPKPKRPVGFRA